MKFVFSLVFISTLLLTACSQSQAPKNEFSQYGFMDGIYSTRPQAARPVLTILKLKAPALLQTARRENGVLKIDEKLLTTIRAEQATTIAALEKISPDIRILIRYRLVLNGLAIYAPQEVLEKIESLPNVLSSEKSAKFDRPRALSTEGTFAKVGTNNSVTFIGANAAYVRNLRGQGMRVGIIDTGVDYTHKMFLGEGTAEAYKNNNPSVANAGFPNKKVVGGIDVVGSEYNTGSTDYNKHIPVPDVNPLDEAGHGTHVAGSVAGIGDGQNTYSGVAPEASLYAIKVFGASGTTSDMAVIAGLEYAADPTADLSFKEQLDVVNLSLGSGYGSAHSLYNQAIKNLSRSGTVVVTSAGNSGDKPYITGSPGVSDEAISTASSLDNQDQNILFSTVAFSSQSETVAFEALEGTISKPLAEVATARAEVVFAGFADVDFDQNFKKQLSGKVALMERGKVTFADKIRRAQEAGAIAVIVANNVDGEPFLMSGEGKFNIPAVMIAKDASDRIRSKLASEAVVADLKTSAKISKPWLIDTVSSFSSRGPRSEDGVIKPEIVAPGSKIISAAMGGGDKGIENSGTSMAAPHIAGVMTLLKQKYRTLDSQELKSVLMGHGKVIANESKTTYPVARQGAGSVQIANSLEAKIVTIPATLSFGVVDVQKQETLTKKISVKNISNETLTLHPQWSGSGALQAITSAVTLAPGETKILTVTVKILASQMKNTTEELDGFFKLVTDQEITVQLPTLVVARKISQISAKSLKVHTDNNAFLNLRNIGDNPGAVYLFNSLGVDARKKDKKPDSLNNRNCDLQSAGYRLIEKNGAHVLQIAVKLFERVTTWHRCEINVQIDSNGDNLPDQEIAGVTQSTLTGVTGDNFMSLLLDGNKAREIRKNYEVALAENAKDIKLNYSPALVDQRAMMIFESSTLAIIEADVSRLALAAVAEMNLKISTTHQSEMPIEYDDYLANQDSQWKKISTNPLTQSFGLMPEAVNLEALESTTVKLQKGSGVEDLVVYSPQNGSSLDVLLEDTQSQLIAPEYVK